MSKVCPHHDFRDDMPDYDVYYEGETCPVCSLLAFVDASMDSIQKRVLELREKENRLRKHIFSGSSN